MEGCIHLFKKFWLSTYCMPKIGARTMNEPDSCPNGVHVLRRSQTFLSSICTPKATKWYWDSSSRWWHRGILNLLPHMDTPHLQLHMGQFPLKETPELAEQLLYVEWTRKNLYQNGKERLRHNLTTNPTPGTSTHTLEGTHNSEHLSE